MPPTRTQQPLSAGPMKLMKTERTHEENQERAYIAASRRSDRSLEARVESARRASEIHKRRTGRGLRVTEKDTGNPEFNHRLEAYLTTNVAMRSALERTISNSYASQGQVSPFPTQYGAAYPSPMLMHQPQQPMSQQRPMPPAMPQNPYRHAPYPSPRIPPPQHAASTAPLSLQTEPANNDQVSPTTAVAQRRSSIPTTPLSASSAGTPTATGKPIFGPFSTTLPHDAQNLLGSPFPAHGAALMGGTEGLPSYPYNPPLPETRSSGKHQMYPSLEGLNSTLAPSTVEQQPSYQHPDFFNEAMASGFTPPSQTPNLDTTDWNSYLNFDELPSSQNSS
ncbi:hypothetical protein BUE80_DR008473 [Diplocarpon rosae]|nr:hypothetical protein BUE80_DR008473 [Diplocarpon rosae]